MKFRADETEEEGRRAAQQRGTSTAEFRTTDDQAEGEEHVRRRRKFAFRVIFMSVLISGIVALGVVYAVELGARNNAVDACNLEMQTRSLLAEQADEAADGVLGDPNEKPPIPAFRFEGTAFAPFKPLIIAQARANRRRASEFARSVQSCNRLFPRPQFFGVFG